MTSLRSALVLQAIRDLFARRAPSRKVLVVCNRCTVGCRPVDLRDISRSAGRLRSLCRPGSVLRCADCRGPLRAASTHSVSTLPSATIIDLAAFRRRNRLRDKPVNTATNRVRGRR